jgi:hypothetical protein
MIPGATRVRVLRSLSPSAENDKTEGEYDKHGGFKASFHKNPPFTRNKLDTRDPTVSSAHVDGVRPR